MISDKTLITVPMIKEPVKTVQIKWWPTLEKGTRVKISFVKHFFQKVFDIGFPLYSVFFVTMMVAWSGDEDKF